MFFHLINTKNILKIIIFGYWLLHKKIERLPEKCFVPFGQGSAAMPSPS